jgi:hypothetical protein
MKFLIFLISFLTVFSSHASRLIEVEDYFSSKTSQFIKARYPSTAFSVSVKANVDQESKSRTSTNTKNIDLPYLENLATNEVNFWDRKDLSLGTLISYVKSVQVRVDMDKEFSVEELNQLKNELFDYLKLAQVYDRLEINQRQWQNPWSLDDSKNQLALILFAAFILSVFFFVILQSGIKKLIKGLSEPLVELGKNKENVSGPSALPGAQITAGAQDISSLTSSVLTQDNKQQFVIEANKLSQFIGSSNPELVRLLETLGSKNPGAMGAVFKEIKIEDLRSAMRWARGDWWRQAVTQPGIADLNAMEYLQDISQLHRKEQLVKGREYDEFDMILARLSRKEFGRLLEGLKFEEAASILSRTSEDIKVSVGKYLYPGQWSSLISDAKPSQLLDAKLKSQIHKKALQLAPVMTEQQVDSFFKEAELLRYLLTSSTKDEREVYKALPQNSWLVSNTVPFYSLLSLESQWLSLLLSNLSLDTIAVALSCCDTDEKEKVYACLTNKQNFVLKKYVEAFAINPPSEKSIELAKKQMMSYYNLLQINTSFEDSKGPMHAAA